MDGPLDRPPGGLSEAGKRKTTSAPLRAHTYASTACMLCCFSLVCICVSPMSSKRTPRQHGSEGHSAPRARNSPRACSRISAIRSNSFTASVTLSCTPNYHRHNCELADQKSRLGHIAELHRCCPDFAELCLPDSSNPFVFLYPVNGATAARVRPQLGRQRTTEWETWVLTCWMRGWRS